LIQPKQPRKLLGTRNGLKIFSKLKVKTPLKAHKRINPISQKQKAKNDLWSKYTEERIVELGGICEWCGKHGKRKGVDNFLSGHHKIKRRFNNYEKSNVYVCHWITCHQFIEQNGVDVTKYPNKIAWENRNG